MSIKTRALGALALLCVSFGFVATAQAADRPYTEGHVLNISAVRTAPGMFEEYMKYVAGPYRQLMEEQKKAGLIVGWNVYATTPRHPDEPDLYLVTIVKNMAALDDVNSKTDAIVEKMFGNLEQQGVKTVERGKLRTLLGDELIRELVLK